jgi:inward rectifier potassium channel
MAKRPPRIRSSQTTVGQYRFTKKGVSQFDLHDPYHFAVALTWPQFFAGVFGMYLLVNVLFALLYDIVPGTIANSPHADFGDAFFFSFETLATVGYGEMYPGTLYGHIVACIEIMTGLSFTAILTGLTFVRFSRPRAKFLFSDNLVMTSYNGVPALMLRVGNGRVGILNDARARISVLLHETTAEGASFRRAHDLRLQRSNNPIFPLSWTLMHTVDEKSPLHGLDAEGLVAADARVFLTFEAFDPTLAARVQDVRSYRPTDIKFGMRFVDIISTDDDDNPIADLTRISVLQADTGDALPFMGYVGENEDPDSAGDE